MPPLKSVATAPGATVLTAIWRRYRQFKALTSMTPLQYQKQLRLLEARNLMAAGQANAEAAAYQVGYESASQFSREYARMFGAPPRRDIATLKTAVA
jgi:AraC-like DNA-binding protein